jgi:hypothetical protein
MMIGQVFTEFAGVGIVKNDEYAIGVVGVVSEIAGKGVGQVGCSSFTGGYECDSREGWGRDGIHNVV